jgi:hypothetical protein
MAEVELRLCDPFFGYLAAIAATIQLEHTGNKNPQIALLVNNEYRALVGFMTELSYQWESVKVLVSIDALNEPKIVTNTSKLGRPGQQISYPTSKLWIVIL